MTNPTHTAEKQFKPEMLKVSQGAYMRGNRKANGVGVQADETRICVVMVGLPARGKSLIASKSELYHIKCFEPEISFS